MKHDISTIKEIVDRFYRGETTPAEIAEATEYFRSVSDIDPLLRADRDIFLALQDEAATIVPPDDLERKIIEATVGKKPRPRILPWVISTISAAAVIVLALIVTPLGTIHQEQPDATTIGLAEIDDTETAVEVEQTITVPEATVEPETAVDEPTQLNATPEVTAPAKKAKIKRINRKKMTPPAPTEKEKEAARLSIELINRALGKADIACANAEETFMEIDRTLNK